jgi:hypothetical protein
VTIDEQGIVDPIEGKRFARARCDQLRLALDVRGRSSDAIQAVEAPVDLVGRTGPPGRRGAGGQSGEEQRQE